MSTKYPGGIITKNYTAPTPTSASGIWTLDQQEQAQKAGIWPFGGPFNYIEDVFSTYLYTGNSSTQTINNGIDLAGKGGLVWGKRRNSTGNHFLVDSARGSNKVEISDLNFYQFTSSVTVTGFNSNGFGIGAGDVVDCNNSGGTYASWTFRKQPKFFDVVTYTGNGASGRSIAHSLGSVPGCIIIKNTSAVSDWTVYHQSTGNTKYLTLNATDAQTTGSFWGNTTPTSTDFTVSAAGGHQVNFNGETYVAYIFAHNSGGFGLTGTDNVISCGSFTTDGSGNATVNLGYEPQWVLTKCTTFAKPWMLSDTMRGMPVGTAGVTQGYSLSPNSSSAENQTDVPMPTATGFKAYDTPSQTYIYIAIRRGPMKVPTDATKVFEPVAYSGSGTNSRQISSSVTPDSIIPAYRNTTGAKYWYDRLRGNGTYLITTGTNAEGSDGAAYGPQFNQVQTGYQQGTSDSGFLNDSSYTYINYLLRRAPNFFDEVCYTGDGTDMTITHNLGTTPELMIVKRRSAAGGWFVYSAGTTVPNNYYLQLQSTAAQANAGAQVWSNTATTFLAGTGLGLSSSGYTYVAYLFATCPGVSKVGSYTGNGSTQTINCGFAGGARFVLIKRTDSTGDWYVYDTARGMTTLTDPYLLLNSTAAESATLGSVTTVTTGFAVNASILSAINTNAASYIYLAIA